MELRLTFSHGTITGDGRDWVGPFVIRGRYDLADGTCYWTKSYLAKHDVFYKGFNEGRGIWGIWEIPTEPPPNRKGGFHIWPEGMPDPTQPTLSEEVEEPIIVEEVVETREPDKVPVGPRVS
jgi:hypothetical protein